MKTTTINATVVTETNRRRTNRTARPAATDNAARAELLIQQHEANAAVAKAAYAENDRILSELHSLLGVEKPVVLTDGRRARIKDNFRDAQGQPKLVAYRPCGVRLFDLEVK